MITTNTSLPWMLPRSEWILMTIVLHLSNYKNISYGAWMTLSFRCINTYITTVLKDNKSCFVFPVVCPFTRYTTYKSHQSEHSDTWMTYDITEWAAKNCVSYMLTIKMIIKYITYAIKNMPFPRHQYVILWRHWYYVMGVEYEISSKIVCTVCDPCVTESTLIAVIYHYYYVIKKLYFGCCKSILVFFDISSKISVSSMCHNFDVWFYLTNHPFCQSARTICTVYPVNTHCVIHVS